uniref:Uncharacterized protein n=1 Tax=Hippocampus comes TaxID=109280 RepID=A0A3Q3DIV8_HIPCM
SYFTMNRVRSKYRGLEFEICPRESCEQLDSVSVRNVTRCECFYFFITVKLYELSHLFFRGEIICMCKKLDSLAKKKSMSILKDWVQSLKCHLYWCALSSQTPEEKKQKWLPCVDHLQNVHDSCLHPPITREKTWLLPGIFIFFRLVELLTKTMFVNNVMKMSHLGQTSGVEAFHSVVNHFAPKMHFLFYSRIILVAMHYNENAGRPQKVTKEGRHSYCVVYPKYKSGGYSLKTILVDATYGKLRNKKQFQADSINGIFSAKISTASQRTHHGPVIARKK